MHSEAEAASPHPIDVSPRPGADPPANQFLPPIFWFGALLIIMFFPVLKVMVKEWGTDESMGHGFFVPFVSGYIAWQRREQVWSTPLRPHWTGYFLIACGFFLLIVGTLGAEFFIMRVGFLSSVLGTIVATCGWPIVRVLALPLGLLIFMLRIPLFIYSQVTFPLQLLASRVAETTLLFLDIPVLRQGNVLELPSQKLNVVEACSGIRSLLSLTFLSLVYGYLFESNMWIRIVLFLATIPIAIAGNALRVTLTGIFSETNPELAQGIYHTFEGWVIFMVALLCLLSLHYILKLVARIMSHPPATPEVS
jgi:exosortase